MRRDLATFIPAPTPSAKTVALAKKALALGTKSFVVPKLQPEGDWRGFFLTYLPPILYLDGKHRSLAVVRTYDLIDIFLGHVEGKALRDFPEDVIVVLHGFSTMPNRREFDILSQFLDYYRSMRRLILCSVSSNAKSFEATAKKLEIYTLPK